MKRYAIVGLGSRAELFARALAGSPRAELVAFCDHNETRMRVHNGWLGAAVPAYRPADFAVMLTREQVDVVVVCTPDHTHAEYIARALGAGCDVVTEKPMATDADGARRILAAREATGRAVRVAFNYRYNPVHRQVRALLAAGAVGEIGSVEFSWLLDTVHGADYFRRWHREKANSGGLLVHKSGHHFDLVGWWLDRAPETVFALGGLVFYGEENGRRHGRRTDVPRGTGAAADDPFALDLERSPRLRALYRDAEAEDGYLRDRNVFAPGVTIEDDVSVLVRHHGGVVLNYHLHAYSPREGYRVAFAGSDGRLELDVRENEQASRDGDPGPGHARLVLQRHWAPPEVVLDEPLGEGHGGGDARMLAELLGEAEPDPLGCAADHEAGLRALLIGVAANRSLATGEVVGIGDLLGP